MFLGLPGNYENLTPSGLSFVNLFESHGIVFDNFFSANQTTKFFFYIKKLRNCDSRPSIPAGSLAPLCTFSTLICFAYISNIL